MKPEKIVTTFLVQVTHTKANKTKYLREDLLELWKWDDDVKVKVKRLPKEATNER